MYLFSLTPQIRRDLAWLEESRGRLQRRGVVPRRWEGRLRRELQAEAIAASSRMEGVNVDSGQARRILSGDRPASVSRTDAALVEGYRNAGDLAFGSADSREFAWSRELVLQVHGAAMAASASAGAGQMRAGPVYVTDGSGAIIYEAPSAEMLPALLDEMCDWMQSATDIPAPVLAALAHARIAGIHPFSDGNGRTARILASVAMYRGGYCQPEFTSLEEWWGSHLRSYYGAFRCLGSRWTPDSDATAFVAGHVRAQRRQVAVLADRLAVERDVWTAIEDLATEDMSLPPRAGEALFDAFFGRTVTNRYYRSIAKVSVATATNDLSRLRAGRLLTAEGEGPSRSYTGSFALLARVASAAGVELIADAGASLAEQRAVILAGMAAAIGLSRPRR